MSKLDKNLKSYNMDSFEVVQRGVSTGLMPDFAGHNSVVAVSERNEFARFVIKHGEVYLHEKLRRLPEEYRVVTGLGRGSAGKQIEYAILKRK